MKNAESHVKDTWDMGERSNIHLIGATEAVERDNSAEEIFEKIIAEMFIPKLMKNIKELLQIAKGTTIRLMTVKLLQTKI